MSESSVNILNKIKLPVKLTKVNGTPAVSQKIRTFGQPLISIIIPVYQEEKILEKTLRVYDKSLLHKHNVELIVSDGGSSDQTVNIAKRYADKVVVHTEQRRQTIAEGRNKGAEVANGDILVFINGDTVPANPDSFLDIISKWFESDNKLSKASALACAVTVEPSEILFKDRIFYALHNFYVRLLNELGMGMGRGECQIVRAEVFKDVKGYNDKLTAGEDFDLFRRIAKKGKVKFTKDLLVHESPRRFRKFGYLRIIISWLINSLSVMMFNRSVSKEWEAVR